MARLRHAPSRAPETSDTTDRKPDGETPQSATRPAIRKHQTPIEAENRAEKPIIVISEDETEEESEKEDAQIGNGFLDLSAEESDADESENEVLSDNPGDSDREDEFIDCKKPHIHRSLQPLAPNKVNTLFNNRRLSARDESRYNEYLSDDENFSNGSVDYEKENDEKGLFNETKTSARGKTQRGSIGIQRSRKSIRRSNLTSQYISEEEGGLDDDEEFDSLDGFIVGDDEDISYIQSTEDEAERTEEEIITMPIPSKRRLLRGRRPGLSDNTQRNTNIMKTNQKKVSDMDGLADALNETKITDSTLSSISSSRESGIMDESTNSNGDCMGSVTSASSTPNKERDKPAGFVTPPSSPVKSRLQSPKKTPQRIPESPYRPNIDAFWNQDIINGWNDKFSPKKLQTSTKAFPKFTIFSDIDNDDASSPLSSPEKAPPRSPTKRLGSPTKSIAAIKKAAKRDFDERKGALANKFFKNLDDLVTGGEIQSLAAETGGVQIIWTKTFNTTAGRANWRRENTKQEQSPGQDGSSCLSLEDHSENYSVAESPKPQTLKAQGRHHASIELGDKVVDSDDRLFNTLAHEYCHLANFMISKVRGDPHGASFKAWARKCKDALDKDPEYAGRVVITTRHAYEINFKYIWSCEDCAHEYGRHSKSIDPEKCRCGKCRGKLLQIQPKPRKTAARKKNVA